MIGILRDANYHITSKKVTNKSWNFIYMDLLSAFYLISSCFEADSRLVIILFELQPLSTQHACNFMFVSEVWGERWKKVRKSLTKMFSSSSPKGTFSLLYFNPQHMAENEEKEENWMWGGGGGRDFVVAAFLFLLLRWKDRPCLHICIISFTRRHMFD